jgi:hypothetical protein
MFLLQKKMFQKIKHVQIINIDKLPVKTGERDSETSVSAVHVQTRNE